MEVSDCMHSLSSNSDMMATYTHEIRHFNVLAVKFPLGLCPLGSLAFLLYCSGQAFVPSAGNNN